MRGPNAGGILQKRKLYSGVLRPNGKVRTEGPSRCGIVFMLRPAVSKVEARRAEAKTATIDLPVFEKFWGKGFPFRPPSGGTGTIADEDTSSPGENGFL